MSATAVGTAADLGRALKHWLRHGPGGPVKVAALARRLRISQSTLYAYLAGTTLPSSEALDDLLNELAVPADEHRRLATLRDSVQRPRGAAGPTRKARPVPAELPADPIGFTGRERELAALDRARADGVPIVVLAGPAGVGKTALAVRWGHRVADGFPDGCLYADLHGYSPVKPHDPAEVLAGFLRSLGLDDPDIPADVHQRAARLRSLLARKRVLVVLDNALDVNQVRPLLPAEPLCFVLVTSRTDLAGLQVRPGAHRVDLRPLSAGEGLDLLRAQLGGQVDRSSDAARELAERCGGLPLALRIVAARAHGRPAQPLAELVDDLRVQGLDLFDVGDPDTAVRTVFSWSLRHLDDEARQDFRLLGAHPAHDIGLPAAAALLGTDVRTATRRLDVLVRAHLIQRSSADRFDMHDLVRAYAREQVTDEEVLDGALVRLVDHFAVTAGQAMDALHPGPAADSPMPVGDAREWVDREWQSLLALVAFTARRGWSTATARLAETLQRHLDQGGRHSDALVVLGHVRDAARSAGDKPAEGAALYHLGVAYLRLGLHEDAMHHHGLALDVCRRAGDRLGEAGALNNLGNLYERLGRYGEALAHYREALALADDLGFAKGRAVVLTNLGVVHTRLGDHDRALRDLREALDIFADPGGTARALGNLAEVHRLGGRIEEALELFGRALELARGIGARGIETEVLNNLGPAYLAAGAPDLARAHHAEALAVARAIGDRYEEARALEGLGSADRAVGPWEEALAIYGELGLPDEDRVRALLSGRSPATAAPAAVGPGEEAANRAPDLPPAGPGDERGGAGSPAQV
ncbi:tetratricopeptide (TPR) repeat protein/transcriptional regulator with XRE-family HTH domain [Saccharothrix tamanrassetensis]|uniref:Tetratricopeptide (TPR) repeat protein/transcriptional regulator with XRE-family HTH domain n=1 Tax=Saccharothrix tamanrassetensis TaxID=1051531 RepID=A0A841CA47_9PSEU|nr:tetratricopeptide repeat protein [Saccharothrix tamanrassetensis]MBB5953840.1 tetratricopeptide (TPR) repeat protein/transcriptional regulator with XRE-family HTH domain [Saccharothrix tamanrassetensis]